MLPFLAQRYRLVDAFDLDPEPTKIMVDRMNLANVDVRSEMPRAPESFDVVTALDVLEHVEHIDAVYDALLHVTAPQGRWVLSGPTESWLYRLMRKVARTSGEGHVRTIYDVFHHVPDEMVLTAKVRLPFGSPAPLFVVATFERR
jgi:hypothetical protein